MNKTAFILIPILFLSILLFPLFNKKEVNNIKQGALVSIILMNSINTDYMYYDDNFFYEHEEEEYQDDGDLIIDIITEDKMPIEVKFNLQSSAEYLKDQIINNSSTLFPYPLLPEDEVISHKPLFTLTDPGDVFVPAGYPGINTISKKVVNDAVNILTAADALIFIQASYGFYVYQQINDEGWGRVSCNLMIEIYNREGKIIVSRSFYENSEEDYQFTYGRDFSLYVLDIMAEEATKKSYAKMSAWLSR